MNGMMGSNYPGDRRIPNTNPFGISRTGNLSAHFQHKNGGNAGQNYNQNQQYGNPYQNPYQNHYGNQNVDQYQNQQMRESDAGITQMQDNAEQEQSRQRQQMEQSNRQKKTVTGQSVKGSKAESVLDELGIHNLKNAIKINEIISPPVSKRKNRSRFGRRQA